MKNVYLISSGEDENKRYKIGITKNPPLVRLKQLSTGNSEKMEIVHVFQSKWATKLESILHRTYQIDNIRGEWFKLSQKQVDNFIWECQNLETSIDLIINHSTFQNPKTIIR